MKPDIIARIERAKQYADKVQRINVKIAAVTGCILFVLLIVTLLRP